MAKRFEGKTVIVTGAGIGIGNETCRRFAGEGAVVALNDLDAAVAQEAARKINAEMQADCVYPYGADVANVEAVRDIVSRFVAITGHLDIVVANAGLTNYGAFLDYTPEAFDRVTGVNLRGTFFTAQAGARAMIERQTAGRIVLMSSVTGIRALGNLSAYGMTKAAIRMMAKSLALELGPYGITINAVAPGSTVTERTKIDDPNVEKTWANVTPTRRTASVEDIASAVLYLASVEAGQISGHTLVVDGGWSAYSPWPEGHPDNPAASSKLK